MITPLSSFLILFASPFKLKSQQSPLWVKTGKAHSEQILSALARQADMRERASNVR
jgi:hypothetical protein